MKRFLSVISLLLSLLVSCRGQWLDEIVVQRDEQEEVVSILRAALKREMTVDSVEEIERNNKYYRVDTSNGSYNEFKRYRLVFSDETTVEFDVLGLLNGVQRDYYSQRGLYYIDEIWLGDLCVSISFVGPDGEGDNCNFLYNYDYYPATQKIYYTSTDDNVVTPYSHTAFGVDLISNTYKNGKGIILFNRDVTTIGNSAFAECYNLATITIPKSVTSIGDSAFQNCSSLAEFKGKFASADGRCLIVDGELKFFAPAGLTEYTIPDGVTSIGEDAFNHCSSLTSINIPEGVTEIGHYAFGGTNLTSVTLPKSLTSLGRIALAYCHSLKDVYCKAITPPAAIADSSTWGAFDYNASNRKIYVPMESIEEYKTAEGWSDYADSIVPYDFEKGEEVNVDVPETWKIYYTSTDGNVVTPNKTDVFGAKIVLNSCKNGQGVIIFDGEVASIGEYAFYSCKDLASITIPDSVTSIGEDAFCWCESLASINIPDGVTSIGDSAFNHCSSLASITIPEGVTSIGEYTFYSCKDLASITIPDGVTSIGGHTFGHCSSLTNVTIGNGVTSIGGYAFWGCSSLASITIPEGVADIGYSTFEDCSSLARVYCKPKTAPIASFWQPPFIHNASGLKIYVPAESVGTYITADGWSNYADSIVPYDFEKGEEVNVDVPETWKIYYTSTDGNVVTPNKTDVFGANILSIAYENGLGVINFNGEVTSIGEYAFYSCKDLASITIPDSVTSIGEMAFTSCSSLASVTIPDSVTEIGFWAFYYCSSLAEFKGKFASADGRCLIVDGKLKFFAPAGLTEYTIPDGVTSIGDYAFSNCSSLTNVTIPDSVTSIGYDAFEDCSSLTSITIPDSVTSIEYNVFASCSSLAEIKGKFATEDGRCLIINGELDSFAPAGLTEYTIPDGVTSIGTYAFYEYSNLISITIPETVTRIKDCAFKYCSKLAEVYCKAITPPDIWSKPDVNAFDNNASGRKIYVPMESIEAYKTAEGWSEYADSIVGYDF